MPDNGKDESDLLLTVKDSNHYIISNDDFEIEGKVGELLDEKGISLKVDAIDAIPNTQFIITYVSRLKAITDLQEKLAVNDQGKDTGILTISMTGDNPQLIEKIVDSISENYLAQNIARQAAQDAKSLDF